MYKCINYNCKLVVDLCIVFINFVKLLKVFSKPGNEVDGIMVEKKIVLIYMCILFIFIYVHDFHSIISIL